MSSRGFFGEFHVNVVEQIPDYCANPHVNACVADDGVVCVCAVEEQYEPDYEHQQKRPVYFYHATTSRLGIQ